MTAELMDLHDAYVWIVNAAPTDERADGLAQGFPDEALDVLTRSR
jgi:hypothetical protein